MSGQPSIPCSGINDCLDDVLKLGVSVKAVRGNVSQTMYEAGHRTTCFFDPPLFSLASSPLELDLFLLPTLLQTFYVFPQIIQFIIHRVPSIGDLS